MHYAKKWVMRKCLIQGYEQVDLLTKKHRDDYWVEKRLMKSNATTTGNTGKRIIIPLKPKSKHRFRKYIIRTMELMAIGV